MRVAGDDVAVVEDYFVQNSVCLNYFFRLLNHWVATKHYHLLGYYCISQQQTLTHQYELDDGDCDGDGGEHLKVHCYGLLLYCVVAVVFDHFCDDCLRVDHGSLEGY